MRWDEGERERLGGAEELGREWVGRYGDYAVVFIVGSNMGY